MYRPVGGAQRHRTLDADHVDGSVPGADPQRPHDILDADRARGRAQVQRELPRHPDADPDRRAAERHREQARDAAVEPHAALVGVQRELYVRRAPAALLGADPDLVRVVREHLERDLIARDLVSEVQVDLKLPTGLGRDPLVQVLPARRRREQNGERKDGDQSKHRRTPRVQRACHAKRLPEAAGLGGVQALDCALPVDRFRRVASPPRPRPRPRSTGRRLAAPGEG